MISTDILKQIVTTVKNCLNNAEFRSKYDSFQLSFFGGEPTLNLDGMQYITNALKDEPVTYFLYTNGYKFKPGLWDFLTSFKDTGKFLTQISYDGLASHNIDRKTANGKQTALAVKETIFKFAELGLDYTIHPTIAAKNFNCIADNYFEFKRMKEFGIDCLYNPTIDYLSKFNFTESELNEIKKILKSEFLKILPHAKSHNEKFGYYDFGWFNYQKAICGAGNGYYAVDLDGLILPCHGNFTSSKKSELSIGSIDSIKPQDLLNSSAKYSRLLEFKPKECLDCYTHLCWKCNAAKYEISAEPEMGWVDYTNQPGLCEIFKYIGRFMIAVNSANQK